VRESRKLEVLAVSVVKQCLRTYEVWVALCAFLVAILSLIPGVDPEALATINASFLGLVGTVLVAIGARKAKTKAATSGQ